MNAFNAVGSVTALAGIDRAFEAVNSLLDASGALESATLQRAVYALRLEIARTANDDDRIAAAEASLQELNPDLDGLDLMTFEGWSQATNALLANMPSGMALVDATFNGYLVKMEGSLLSLPARADGNWRFLTEWGVPMDAVEIDRFVWGANHNQALRRSALLQPIFATLVFQEQSDS